MKLMRRVYNWCDKPHPKILDVIRMLLGIFLVIKGAFFFSNYVYLRDLILENGIIKQPSGIITFLILYTTYVHLVGGTLLFFGLFTRIVALLQLPVVFGAVFFVNIFQSPVNSELWLSILVMALLCLYIVIGSGLLSLDHYFQNWSVDYDGKNLD